MRLVCMCVCVYGAVWMQWWGRLKHWKYFLKKWKQNKKREIMLCVWGRGLEFQHYHGGIRIFVFLSLSSFRGHGMYSGI